MLDNIMIQPLLAAINERKPRTIAIEGGSGAGKTTLAQLLQKLYCCDVVHMDDFFLPPKLRTRGRLAETGGNVHYERFLTEVISNLGGAFSYRAYNCKNGDFDRIIQINGQGMTIVEGVYSMHPIFGSPYDLTVFMDISPELQCRRIVERNGKDMYARFMEEWIPLENEYFKKYSIRQGSDIVIEVG